MSKTFSGGQVIKILCREFGFFVVSQNGSHVKLRRTAEGRTVSAIVPEHEELFIGTFKKILKQGEVDEKEFRSKNLSTIFIVAPKSDILQGKPSFGLPDTQVSSRPPGSLSLQNLIFLGLTKRSWIGSKR